MAGTLICRPLGRNRDVISPSECQLEEVGRGRTMRRGGRLAVRREHSYHHDLQQAGISPRICGMRSDDGGWSYSEPLAKTSCRLFVCQHFILPREAGPRRGSHIHYVRMSRKDRIRWVHRSSCQLPHFHAINHHGPGTA